MQNDYQVEEISVPSLMSRGVGLYTESIIFNYSTFNIGIIRADGSKEILAGVSEYYGGTRDIVIQQRTKVAKTLINTNREQEYLPGIKITIQPGTVLRSPVYIKELNIVIASEQDANVVKHPYGCMNYSDAAHDAVIKFEEAAKESILLSITANDPLGKHKYLYTAVGNEIVKIPIQCEHDATLDPKLIYLIKEAEGSTVMSVDLTSLYTSKDGLIYLENSIVGFLALDEDIARHCLESYKVYNQDTMQRYINDIKNDYDNKFMETKNSFELDRMSLENQIKRLKDANIQQEHEYNILSAKYDSILGTLTFKDNQEERDIKIETLHNAKHISNNSLGISNTKATTTQMESDYKFWQIVAVGAVPLIALGVGMLAKKWLDK